MVEYADHLALVAAAYRDAGARCGAHSYSNNYFVSKALHDAATDILARTPADAEAHLTALLRAEYERGKAADATTRLSHALAAETAKQEAMEAELHSVEVDLAEAEDKFHIASFYISDEQTKNCVMDRVKWMAKAGSRVRATLAKHGSKT